MDDLFLLDQPIYVALNRLRKREWKHKIAIKIPEHVVIVQKELVTIEEGVTIAPFAYIEGPCYIGKNSRIGHGAFIRPYTYLAEGSVVGHASEVKESIFFKGAKAPHFCYVGDSILGREVNLGAGTKCANVRFDKKEIFLRRHGEKVSTSRTKLGAIMGDFSQTGCNVVLQPGTILEKRDVRLATAKE